MREYETCISHTVYEIFFCREDHTDRKEHFMQQQSPPTYAAIDIGSNTTQITVARCQPETLDIVAHESEMLRIGESVTKTGEISSDMQEAVIKTLQKYQNIAKQHNAEHVL